MERRALVLALALTLPLVLYGIPYAYAGQTSSSYEVLNAFIVSGGGGTGSGTASCNSGDYATGGGFTVPTSFESVQSSYGKNPNHSSNPIEWYVFGTNNGGSDASIEVFVVCQIPITVAGVGVPEFGQLYIAIALGAVVFFVLSRQFSRRPAISAKVKV